MDFFFNPRSVAVIGATANPLKGGNAIVKNLLAGFEGEIYPVNPKYRQIEGLACYPSLKDISAPVDLAIIFIPAGEVPAAAAECAACGVPGVMIESGGFAESGSSGRHLQKQLTDLVQKTGIRLWGPNCMGLVDALNRRVFSFMEAKAVRKGFTAGPVSLIVQSGMLSAGFLVDIMSNNITGISKVCSIGNKIDVNETDLLGYLINDPTTEVIGLYVESISAGRRFVELCRKSTKPIVVLKGGKSPKGAEAAMSHTAALAANYRLLQGIFAQAGIVEAGDFKQMVDICRSLAAFPQRPPGSGRIALITFSGGAGIVAADFMAQTGLSVAELASTTIRALQDIFPKWMPPANPVDIWPALEKNFGTDIDVYKESMKAILEDPGVDAVFLLSYAGNPRLAFNLAAIAVQAKEAGKPLFVWLLGNREEVYKFQTEAMALDVPLFQEINRAVECLDAVFRPRAVDVSPEEKTILPVLNLPSYLARIMETVEGPLDEYVSKRILSCYSVPVVREKLVEDIEECLAAAAGIGYPLVMKGITAGGVHKTEMGLVELGIRDRRTAGQAFRGLMGKMKNQGKVLLQEQAEGKVELILGLVRDPQFGLSVMLGIGGIMAEIFRETVFALAPLSQQDALALIERFHGRKLLEGFRGFPAADKEKLAALLVSLGNIGIIYPRIKEIDINPLIITKAGAVAVDAAIILDKW